MDFCSKFTCIPVNHNQGVIDNIYQVFQEVNKITENAVVVVHMPFRCRIESCLDLYFYLSKLFELIMLILMRAAKADCVE